jgi:hypothetical protein
MEQFAEFQRTSLRLSVIRTGEAHHDAAEETSARLLTKQVSSKSSLELCHGRQPRVSDWHQLHHCKASCSHAHISQLYSRIWCSAPDSQSSQSICVSFQAMAAVSPPSSCNRASLLKGSSKGSLDSSDGGRMQSPVGFLSDPALPFNRSIDHLLMHGHSEGLAAVVCESCGIPSEFRLSLGSRPDLRASAWFCSSLLPPETQQPIFVNYIIL